MADHGLSLLVGDTEGDQRLDAYLADHLGSRSAAQRAITDGRVSVDGDTRAKRYIVNPGQTVTVRSEESTNVKTDAVTDFKIIFEDEHLLIVDKGADVVVHPGAGNRGGTLVQALGDRVAGGDDPIRPGVVHRLDRGTSGLIIFGRNSFAVERLQEMLKEREVSRGYCALVEGVVASETGRIDAPIGRDRRSRTRMSLDSTKPREARTLFEVKERLSTTTLLSVKLETGRTHQIRVHMEAIGHPVVGDPVYGGKVVLGLDRQFLHAASLGLLHPVTGEQLEFHSELPRDLVDALERARVQSV